MEAKSHWGYRAEQLEAWRPSLAVTAEQLRSQPAFVLEADSVVVFYSLRVVDGACELDNLWVAPSEVGRGQVWTVAAAIRPTMSRRVRL
jgi:hypothetical protein